jgi:hypothetical protein
MSLLFIACHMRGTKLYKDDYDYVTESVAEQLLLILWTSVTTLIAVGIILSIAL